MRRFNLLGAFLILLAALYFLWQYRFERTAGISTVRLEDLKKIAGPIQGAEWLGTPGEPNLRLRVNPGEPGSVARFDLPGMQAVDLLHLKFVVSARQLRPGKETWQDGRCIIEWHPPTGGPGWQNDLFETVRRDHDGVMTELVAKPQHSPAIPVLRLENLGQAGDLEMSFFEATAIHERMVWKIGRWVLIAAFLAWAFAWIGYRGKGWVVRSLGAGAIWIVMGLYFAVPGPWGFMRSFGTPFQIGPQISGTAMPAPASHSATAGSANARPVPMESVGKIPITGDLSLRIKMYAQKARTILHAFLLFGPTFLIACLVGRRSGLSLAIIFALAIEAAQFAFGYGFDLTDISDLACDALGIALALIVHHQLQRRWPRLIAC